MIVLGVAAVAWSVWTIAANGWRVWWRDYHRIVGALIGGLWLGIAFVRAAGTGRDPYVSESGDGAAVPESDPPSA